jgi:hypothetical protein
MSKSLEFQEKVPRLILEKSYFGGEIDKYAQLLELR